MKSTAVTFLLVLLSVNVISQNKLSGLLTKSSSSQEKIILIDSLLFIYRYEKEATCDSIRNVLFSNQAGTLPNRSFEYYYKSEIAKSHSKYQTAAVYLDSAIYYCSNGLVLGTYYKKKGQIYAVLNDLAESYKNYSNALHIAESQNDLLFKAEVYTSLGEFNRKAVQYDNGIKYLDSALAIYSSSITDNPGKINALDRYAAILNETGKISEAMYYSHQALKLAEQLNDIHAQAVSHNELGYSYEHLQKLDSAEYHYDKAIELWKSIGAERYLANAQFNLSRLFLIQTKYYSAKDLLFSVEQSTIDKGWYELYPMMYEKIALIYAAEGDSLGFYKYMTKSKEAFNIMNHEENKKKMIELSLQYQQDVNLRIIENQQSEIELKETNIKLKGRQTSQLALFLLVATVLIITMFFVLSRSRKAKKRVVQINSELAEALKAKDTLLKEVHHRVKNNFQMIYSLITLQAIGMEDEKAIAALDNAQARIHSMALVHQQLYSGDSYDRVNLKKFLVEVSKAIAPQELVDEDFLFVEDEELTLHIEQAIPLGIILHELLTNSIKYAWIREDSRKIRIKIVVNEGYLSLSYWDNGKGLPDNFKIKNSKTLGLRLIDLFVHRQLKGGIEFKNENGALFNVKFKIL